MSNKLLFFLSIVILGLNSCQKNDRPSSDSSTKSESNLSYGSDNLQKFDLYLPANRSTATTKSVIFIHGGAWSEGDKTDFNPYIENFKSLEPGYAIFNINYRLYQTTGSNLFPTQENDVKAAVEFINNHRNEYGISDKFVLLGASAGGHLSLLQAYKYNTPKIKAVVNFFGPSDMAAMYNDPASIFAPPATIAALFNGAPVTQAALYASSSPINFVTAQSPPTITLQGGVDILVKPTQQTALKTKLDANGVVNQYVLYPTENHGWTGANLDDSFLKIKAFLDANVQ